MNAMVQEELPEGGEEKTGWVMKSLQPKHKQICSLLAQGIPRQTIAQIAGVTPEYISMLSGQKLMQDYIKELAKVADLQLEAMFVQSVEAIGDTLANGNHAEKMKAARLQMEATRRIGSKSVEPEKLIDTNNRLAKLAERLLYLQGNIQTSDIITAEVISHEEVQEGPAWQGSHQPAQEDGNG